MYIMKITGEMDNFVANNKIIMTSSNYPTNEKLNQFLNYCTNDDSIYRLSKKYTIDDIIIIELKDNMIISERYGVK